MRIMKEEETRDCRVRLLFMYDDQMLSDVE